MTTWSRLNRPRVLTSNLKRTWAVQVRLVIDRAFGTLPKGSPQPQNVGTCHMNFIRVCRLRPRQRCTACARYRTASPPQVIAGRLRHRGVLHWTWPSPCFVTRARSADNAVRHEAVTILVGSHGARGRQLNVVDDGISFVPADLSSGAWPAQHRRARAPEQRRVSLNSARRHQSSGAISDGLWSTDAVTINAVTAKPRRGNYRLSTPAKRKIR